jgi:hypothetical protein
MKSDIYAPELFYNEVADETFLDEIKTAYIEMQKLYFKHHTARTSGNRPDKSYEDCIPMHPEYHSDVWKLFLGQDRDDPMTYEDIDSLLLFADEPGERQLPQFKEQRLEFHKELLKDKDFKDLTLDDVVWRIPHGQQVPWLIPVQFSWCNSRVASPKDGTLSELFECSRILRSNATLYQDDDIYKVLLPKLMNLEKQVMFDPERACPGTICSLFGNWFNPHYVFCKRLFTVMVLHDPKVGWSMFLVFNEALVQNNKDKILVPSETVIASLDGEIRPLDVFKEDAYALRLIKKDLRGWSNDPSLMPREQITYLVNTLTRDDNRPSVGGSGFFANTTCEPDVWFACKPHWIDDNRKGTVIVNGENSYRHSMITASENITGQMILKRQWPLDTGFEGKLLLPVEWKYGQGDEDGMREIQCECMTKCYNSEQAQKSRILIHDTTLVRPPGNNWTAESVRALDIGRTKKEGILKYLDHYHPPKLASQDDGDN